MALKLSETLDNGIIADYWKIVDCNVRTGQVCLALFKDKTHAVNRKNMLTGRVSFNIEFDLEELEKEDMNPLKYAYLKIKESKPEPKLDEEGNPIEEDGEPILEESNKWNSAEDC